MKFKTKLIPFAVVATTTAAIVPLTVACGNQTTSLTDINSVAAAKPTFNPRNDKPTLIDCQAQWQVEHATNEYLKFVKANPQYFVEDLKWGVYQNYLSAYENSNYEVKTSTGLVVSKFHSEIKSLKFSASTPKFGTAKVEMPQPYGKTIFQDVPTVSIDVKIEADVHVKTLLVQGLSSYTTKESDIHTETSVSYDNMMFNVIPGQRDNKIDLDLWMSNVGYPMSNLQIHPETPIPEVDTLAPGWFVTFSSFTNTIPYYNYISDSWKLSYDSKVSGTETIQINDQDKTTGVIAANVSKEITKASELDNLVNTKNYHANWGLSKAANADIKIVNNNYANWFNQSIDQIVATSVVMDTVSHYFDNTVALPTMIKDSTLGGRFTALENVDIYDLDSNTINIELKGGGAHSDEAILKNADVKEAKAVDDWQWQPSTAWDLQDVPYKYWDTTHYIIEGTPIQAPLLEFTSNSDIEEAEVPVFVPFTAENLGIDALRSAFSEDEDVKAFINAYTPAQRKLKFSVTKDLKNDKLYYVPFKAKYDGETFDIDNTAAIISQDNVKIEPAFVSESYILNPYSSYDDLIEQLVSIVSKRATRETWKADATKILNLFDEIDLDSLTDDTLTLAFPEGTFIMANYQKENPDATKADDFYSVKAADLSGQKIELGVNRTIYL